MKTLLSVIIVISLCTTFSLGQSSRVKYCYDCRSRGTMGDCGDPFHWNKTTIKELNGVESVPCASGWCLKTIEGREGDTSFTTERKCLNNPPSDSIERCAIAYYESKREPVFMCSCHGDLCNRGSALSTIHLTILSMISSLTLWLIIH